MKEKKAIAVINNDAILNNRVLTELFIIALEISIWCNIIPFKNFLLIFTMVNL